MRKHLLPAALAALGFTACQRSETAQIAAQVERGRYLVENVAMCADCHSPRGPNGEFDPNQWLQGMTLPFKATVPMPWSPASPPIAGMPGYTKAQAITFLTEGRAPHGRPILPPMPAYRFSRPDAEAVFYYLKSLEKKG